MGSFRPVELNDVEPYLPPYRKSGKALTTTCVFHEDRKPSMAVYEDGFKCFSCGEHGSLWYLLKQLKGEPMEPIKNVITNKQFDKPKYNLEAIWAKLPMLPKEVQETLEETKGVYGDWFQEMMGWRWHTNEIKGWSEGIFIPYNYQGKMLSARLRRMEGEPRFMGLPGAEAMPYNLDRITHPTVYVTEGETDCLSLEYLNIPAVGIPGATVGTAIRKLMLEANKYETKLVVLPDNDQAGRDFASRVRAAAFDYSVAVDVHSVPEGYKDVSDFYLHSDAGELELWLMCHAQKDYVK